LARLACSCVLSTVSSTALLVGWPGVALAFHTENERITDDTAWTAEQWSFRFGLYKAELAWHDRFTTGTYLWPWLLNTSSLYGKWRFYSEGNWDFAARAGFFHLDSRSFGSSEEANAVFTVVPLELATTYRIDFDDRISQALIITAVDISGTADNDALRGAAQGGVTNTQYMAVYEHRYSSKLALVVTSRILLAQVARANANLVWHPDEFTTIELHGGGTDATSLDVPAAFSVVPAFVWSWNTFNLRLGLGYGNINVPGVNFVLPTQSFIPDVDMYWVLDD
jgi:hypothetical protein